MRLDPMAVEAEIDDAVARNHVAYGGGVAVFLQLHGHCFQKQVLERTQSSPAIAAMLELPQPLPPVPVVAVKKEPPPAPTGPGFYEELKRKTLSETKQEAPEAKLVTPELEWAEGQLSVHLPGVKASMMDLEVSEESFRLSAGDFFLEQKVKVDGTSAKLKKGVLTLKLL